MTRKILGIFISFFIIGGGLALVAPVSAPAGSPPLLVVAPRHEALDAPNRQPVSIAPPVSSTTEAPAVIVVGKRKRCGEEINAKLVEYGLPVEFFSPIAYRESRCNPNAINATWDSNGNMTYALNRNKTYDSGLLQINSGHRELVRQVCGKRALDNNMAGLRDIDCNLAVAAWLYNKAGLAPWQATWP